MFSIAENRKSNFVKDGIVDPDTYFSRTDTPHRVLFILKEANDPKGGGWDLRDYLGKGARWQTWNNVTRWAVALGASSMVFEDGMHIDNSIRQEVLAHIAAVNLKKTPGGSTACSMEIRHAANENAGQIIEQIAECNPDIIVCCGATVADGLSAILADEGFLWKEGAGHRYGRYGTASVLEFWHPAARKSKTDMVDEIVQLYRASEQEA